jgi:hypothetical protein
MTVELKKLSLLEWVANLTDEQVINDLYKSVDAVYRRDRNFDFSTAQTYAQTKMEAFDLDRIKRQQNYKGVDEEKMDELIAQLNIEQSIDELLNDLD